MDTSLAEEIQQTMVALAPDRPSLMSSYRSLTMSGCFACSNEPIVNGDSPDSPFQQKFAALLANVKVQGIRDPMMVGAIPLDPRQPSSLYIPGSWQPFSRQKKQASARRFTRSQSLNVVECQATPEQTMFEQMVARATAPTATPQVDKVVLSWLIDTTTDAAIDNGILLGQLIAQNPASYNFHVPLAGDDILLRASPELLLRKNNERLSSILLAGSAYRQPDEMLDREVGNCLLASERDHHEHKPVIQAMREVLRKRNSELYVTPPPQLVITPTLWHPATPFEGKVNSQENTPTLACLLHPTPMLSGSPYRATTQVIAELEPFDRELSGGIVGWCDSEGNSEWVVTIHCAKLRENQVHLFAGTRTMPVSSPLDEWHEAGVKLSTMSSIPGLH